MPERLKLLFLYGGRSSEHEISLASAASVLKHLDQEKYAILPVGIDKEGQFFQNDLTELLIHQAALPVRTNDAKQLPSLLNYGRLNPEADLVFPMLHGPLYEDGAIQGMLDLANVPYVGSPVLGSALGMDKEVARLLVSYDQVLSARSVSLCVAASAATQESICDSTAQRLGWPLFVKPCSLGSSIGIHKVHNKQELMAAVKDAARYDETVLIEEYIEGREIELAVLEDLDFSKLPKVSIAGEIAVHHPDGFYSYRAKYLESQQTSLQIPAELSPAMHTRLQEAAALIFKRLKCSGMARVDFFVDEKTNRFYFNEINTLPGFTTISMYPKLWEASGLAYPALLDHLIELGMKRHQLRQRRMTNYQ